MYGAISCKININNLKKQIIDIYTSQKAKRFILLNLGKNIFPSTLFWKEICFSSLGNNLLTRSQPASLPGLKMEN